MKKELTIEHLAAYLPYGVRCQNKSGDKMMIGGVDWDFGSGTILMSNSEYPSYYMSNRTHKLILRPLSDLTKPITHNGETFVPIEKMQMDLIVDRTDLLNINGMFDMGIGHEVEWQIIKMLHSWHFDTFGLIEAGLAIDINTINK